MAITLNADTGISTPGLINTAGTNESRGNITQHATTMDLFAVTSPDILDGTGSAVTITACVNAPQAGATRKFYPIVATVLTHGATFDITGNANLTAAAGDCWIIEAKTVSTYRVKADKEDGTAVVAIVATLGTELASTSGTAIDFTGIPAGTKEIKIMLVGVSTGASSNYIVQLGDAGGMETSGYVSQASRDSGAVAGSTAGLIMSASIGASQGMHGTITLTLENSSAFTWTATGMFGASVGNVQYGCGSKSLSQELSQVRLTTVSADTFNAGAVNIQYRS